MLILVPHQQKQLWIDYKLQVIPQPTWQKKSPR